MNNGTIVITWTIGPASDTPTSVTVTLTNNVHSLQKTASGGAPVEFTVASGDVAQFAGSQVAIYVAFVVAPKGEHAMASTSLDVPGTAPPSPNPPPPGHYTVPPPTGLGVTWNSLDALRGLPLAERRPGERRRLRQGPRLVGYAGRPFGAEAADRVRTGREPRRARPVYPNTGYHFQVEGGVSQGVRRLHLLGLGRPLFGVTRRFDALRGLVQGLVPDPPRGSPSAGQPSSGARQERHGALAERGRRPARGPVPRRGHPDHG